MEHSSAVTGRRKYSAAQRQEFVTLYRESGLTQVEFARQHEIKACTFHRWLGPRKQPTAPCPVFTELLLSPPTGASAWSTEILLGRDITVRFGASVPATFMAELVNGLRRPC